MLGTIVTAYGVVNLSVHLYKLKALWRSHLTLSPIPYVYALALGLMLCPYVLSPNALLPLKNKETCRKKNKPKNPKKEK